MCDFLVYYELKKLSVMDTVGDRDLFQKGLREGKTVTLSRFRFYFLF